MTDHVRDRLHLDDRVRDRLHLDDRVRDRLHLDDHVRDRLHLDDQVTLYRNEPFFRNVCVAETHISDINQCSLNDDQTLISVHLTVIRH